MARRPVLSDEEILVRARSVFVEQGYAARAKQVAAWEAHARVVLALLTGAVAQRFVARERTLTADPAFPDGAVRLLSAN